jgi:hypothetical protein
MLKTNIQNLAVLPAGMIPPNPAELLGSKRCDEYFATLAEHFDGQANFLPVLGDIAANDAAGARRDRGGKARLLEAYAGDIDAALGADLKTLGGRRSGNDCRDQKGGCYCRNNLTSIHYLSLTIGWTRLLQSDAEHHTESPVLDLRFLRPSIRVHIRQAQAIAQIQQKTAKIDLSAKREVDVVSLDVAVVVLVVDVDTPPTVSVSFD